MSFRKPTHAYWSLWLIAVPYGFSWVLEAFIKTQPWWASLPLTWLTALFIAVGVGLVLGDAYNPHSWLRHNIREFNKVFEVNACFIGQELTPHQFFEIVCLLKFTKDIKNATLIVRVIQVLPWVNQVHVVHDEKITMPKDSERRLRLGSIPIPQSGDTYTRHALWGEALGEKDLLPNQSPLLADLAVIEISVNKQKYRASVSKEPIFITDVHAPIALMNEADLQAVKAA